MHRERERDFTSFRCLLLLFLYCTSLLQMTICVGQECAAGLTFLTLTFSSCLPKYDHMPQRSLHSVIPQDIRDFKDSRSSRREANVGLDPRQMGPQHQSPYPPRRPFTRDGSTPRRHSDSAGHYQNRRTDRGTEHMSRPTSAFQHMGAPDARDADLSSHGPAESDRNPPGTYFTNDRPARGYSRPHNAEGHMHMHPDAERAQHGRSGSQGRYADSVSGSRMRTDKPGYDAAERRAGSRSEMGCPPARLDTRGQHTSGSRLRHQHPEDPSDVVAPLR